MIMAFSRIRRFLVIALASIGTAASGAAWAQDSVPVRDLSRLTHIHGIAVDPLDPTRLYVATHHGLYAATESGDATRVSQAADDFMGFTPDPDDPMTLYASGHPAGGGNLGLIQSTDGGKTWRQLSPGADGPADFHQLVVCKADPTRIYGAFKGLQVSRDGGRNWTRAGRAPDGLIDLAASAFNPDTLYAATEGGLLVSDDAGAAWRPAHVLLQPASVVETDGRGKVYAFLLGQGLIAASEGEFARWDRLSDRFGDRYLMHLAFDPVNPDRLYAATQHSDVLVSDDGGRNWRDFGSR